MNRAIEFSGTALNTVLFNIDFRDYETVASVQVTATGVATVTYEVSNDGTTWVTTTGNSPGVSGTAGTTSTAAGMWVFLKQSRYFRGRISAFTSGTVVGIVAVGNGLTK